MFILYIVIMMEMNSKKITIKDLIAAISQPCMEAAWYDIDFYGG